MGCMRFEKIKITPGGIIVVFLCIAALVFPNVIAFTRGVI